MSQPKRIHPNRKPFLEWMLKTRPTAAIAVADLAGEMALDRCWPRKGTLEQYRQHLRKHTAWVEPQVALGWAYRSWIMGDEQYVAREPGPVQLRQIDRYDTLAVDCPHCGNRVYLEDDGYFDPDAGEFVVVPREGPTVRLGCRECDESFEGVLPEKHSSSSGKR